MKFVVRSSGFAAIALFALIMCVVLNGATAFAAEKKMPKTYKYPAIEKIAWDLGMERIPNAKDERHRFTPKKMHFLSEGWEIEKDSKYPYTIRNRHIRVGFMEQKGDKWLIHYYMLYHHYNSAKKDWSGTSYALRELPWAVDHITDYKP